MRPLESETENDSLGVSADSDGQDLKRVAVPLLAAAENADLVAYGLSLGVDLSGADANDVELTLAVREGFDAVLPEMWTEHVDAEGRVYYFNQISSESGWSHPMDSVYRELIEVVRSIRRQQPAADHPERRSGAVREHLLEVHQRALEQLAGWSGPYPTDAGQYYYFNESLGLSTWVSPIDSWEYELAVRHSVLHRCLLAGLVSSVEAQSQPNTSADLLVTPALNLPLGLARREDDGTASARSFYTARESSRSQASARSNLGEACQSPIRRRRPSPAADDLASQLPHEASSAPPTPAAGPSTGLPLQATCEEADDDGALEVTFGSAGQLQMPKLEATS